MGQPRLPRGPPAANPTATYTVTMTKDSNGHVTQTIVNH
jgi:hypothetical protein